MVAAHYSATDGSRVALAVGIAASLAIHTGILFGLSTPRLPIKVAADRSGAVFICDLANLRDLEEPELVAATDAADIPDIVTLAPTLVDTLTVPKPDDFVQRVDLSTLIERPPHTGGPVMTIPKNMVRTGRTNPGDRLFDPKELDRAPVAIVQPPPTYPHAFKRDALEATVMVGFVVDASGAVSNAHAVNSTHPGFNDAAVAGVLKWKFRPGVHAGRKVNTRMLVPIVFRLTDDR